MRSRQTGVVTLIALVTLILAAAIVFEGCTLLGGNGRGQGNDEPGLPDGVETVDPGSLTDPVLVAWANICRLVAGVHVLPEFEPEERTYLMVAYGERGTAGYEVVTTVTSDGGSPPSFSFSSVLKAPDGPAATVLTYPADVFVVNGPWTAIADVIAIDENGEALVPAIPSPANLAFVPVSPLPGDTVTGTTLHIEGFARVFEATLQYALEDGHNVLAQGFTMADQGAPEWGRYSLDIEFAQPTSPGLTLRVFEYSMKDGSIVNEVVIPLTWGGQ